MMRIVKQLRDDLMWLDFWVKKCSVPAEIEQNLQLQQTNGDQSLGFGDSIDLNLLFESLSSTLGACRSDCNYHHVHLLLSELEPNEDSYLEKVPKEEASSLSLFISSGTGEIGPNQAGYRTGHDEWRSLKLELHPETGKSGLVLSHLFG